MGSPAKEAREWTIHHLPPSLKALWDWVGHEAPELDHSAGPKVSPHTAASNQALPSPRSLTMARKQAANLNPLTRRRTPPVKMRMWRSARVMLRFRVMARWPLMATRVRDALQSKTLSLVSATSSACMRRLTQSLTSMRRSNPSGGSSSNSAPRRTHPPRTRAIHLPKKSNQRMRPSMTRPGNGISSWTQILMLGGTRRLLKALQAGLQETP